MQYTHGIVVVRFVVVMSSAHNGSCDYTTHMRQDCFTGAGTIIWLPWSHFYQTRSAWSVDQGSNKNHSPAYNFTPTVTKFCVMWEGLSLPHDTKFGNCRCKIVDSRSFPSWSLIHGLRWSGLIKVGPGASEVALKDMRISTSTKLQHVQVYILSVVWICPHEVTRRIKWYKSITLQYKYPPTFNNGISIVIKDSPFIVNWSWSFYYTTNQFG